MKVTIKKDSEAVRIYFNDILHLRFPVTRDIRIQSWVEGVTSLHVIEITCNGHTDRVEYEDGELWVKVLKLLDKNL